MFKVSNMKRIAFNLGVSYTNSLLGFIVSILLARLLGAVDYSMVAIGIAVGGFLVPLMDIGSAKTFVRDVVALKNSRDIGCLSQENLNIRLTVSWIISLLLFVVCFIYFDNVLKAVSIALLSLWVGSMGLYPTSWFDYFHKTVYQNICVVIERMLVVLAIIVLMQIDITTSVVLVVASMLFMARSVSVFSQVIIWWRRYSTKLYKYKFVLPHNGAPGINIHFTIALLSNALLVYGNQLLLAHTGDDIGLSAYSFSFQLISLILIFQAQAIRMLNRDISDCCQFIINTDVFRNIFRHLSFVIFVSIVISLFVYVISGYIPLILKDERFGRINEFIPLLCGWVVIVGAGQVITQYLLEIKEERFHLITSLVGGLVAIILGIVAVPLYGAIAVPSILIGVHSATIGAYFLRVLYVIRLRKGGAT